MAVSLGIKAVMVENTILNQPEDPEQETTDLKVYPNPFSSEVTFILAGRGVTSTTITIYDNSGRVVSAGEYRNIFPGELTVPLPGLAPGIYHYGLRADSVFYSGTLVKTGTE